MMELYKKVAKKLNYKTLKINKLHYEIKS
jgi:hypothetical protein